MDTFERREPTERLPEPPPATPTGATLAGRAPDVTGQAPRYDAAGNGDARAGEGAAPWDPPFAAGTAPGDGRTFGPVVERPRGEREAGAGGRGPLRLLGRAWPLLLLALTKFKWLAVIFKFKAFTTFWTMLASVGAYAVIYGLPFAVGFVALLFVHEMGHALVLKQQGVKATAPIFIPFMGAMIGMRSLPKNAYAEAKMALGGPLLGSLGALACLLLWQVTGSPLFLALAYTGFILNLFNLVPISPLDGGRAMAAISRWGWALGLVLLVGLFLRLHSLILGIILLVGGLEFFQRWRASREDRAYYEVTPRQRLAVAVTYFGLAALLALLLAALQPQLLELRPRR